jgi:2-methylcitrate dehydratase
MAFAPAMRSARSRARSRRFSTVTLPRDSNQALGLANYAIDFCAGKHDAIDRKVLDVCNLFHVDSVMCGVSALAMKTNAPTVLRAEALRYADPSGATVFGSSVRCAPEKAICANSSAVREWDSNGTVFGFRGGLPGHQAGEFGHNDFYPVIVAAAQKTGTINGEQALKAMICHDEIRGRLAEVFSLKSYKVDHVVHGAIASAAVYGALLGATPEQIESAIGMCVAHYIPFRAIRAGKQISDSKGASAALSTEAAVLSMQRSMDGFLGPRDIFRNPESIFRFFEPTTGVDANKNLIDITLANKVRWGPGDSPFNIVLANGGDDFAVAGMHFKLGLYEHQSAGALQAVVDLITKNPQVLDKIDTLQRINITCYEPAFGIIGDPAKRSPTTRQSADHSMVFIVSRMIQNALKCKKATGTVPATSDDAWKAWMLSPYDYGYDALHDPETKGFMEKITFEHGGAEYDSKYPEGIPTSLDMHFSDGTKLESGFIMFPSGHARNTTADLVGIMKHKHEMMAALTLGDKGKGFYDKVNALEKASTADMMEIYNYDVKDYVAHKPIDG